MGPRDAILAGFADYFVPREAWADLTAELVRTGDWEAIDRAAQDAPEGRLAQMQADINTHFGGETLADILRSLNGDDSDFAAQTLKAMRRNAPLSVACAIEMVHRLRGTADIRRALELEYRFTHRAMEHADFLEGIRAAIIDKDRTPKWRHASLEDVTGIEVTRMLLPLGEDALKLEEELS